MPKDENPAAVPSFYFGSGKARLKLNGMSERVWARERAYIDHITVGRRNYYNDAGLAKFVRQRTRKGRPLTEGDEQAVSP
jgi:hypothetical protein